MQRVLREKLMSKLMILVKNIVEPSLKESMPKLSAFKVELLYYTSVRVSNPSAFNPG